LIFLDDDLNLSAKYTKHPKLFDIKDDKEIFEFGVDYYA
jgi:dTDP-4-dehydrorhamnose 3,5-epimerase